MRELTDDQKRQIHDLAHLPQRDVARRLRVGLGTVSKVLAAPPPAKKGRKAAPPAKSRKPSPSAVPALDAAEGEGEGTPVERLERATKSLESAARQAAADGDIARVIQAQKAVGEMTALIERLRPAAAVPVDDRPDMQAAAERGRRHMHELLDRLLREKK